MNDEGLFIKYKNHKTFIKQRLFLLSWILSCVIIHKDVRGNE